MSDPNGGELAPDRAIGRIGIPVPAGAQGPDLSPPIKPLRDFRNSPESQVRRVLRHQSILGLPPRSRAGSMGYTLYREKDERENRAAGPRAASPH